MYHKEGFTQICPRALLYSRPFLSFSFPTHKVLLIQDVDSLSCMDLFPTPHCNYLHFVYLLLPFILARGQHGSLHPLPTPIPRLCPARSEAAI